MLQSIEISNYAIIEKLKVTFSSGLTIVTGETGAGKSILMGALGLIQGKRADSKVLLDPTKKCIVEGTFQVNSYGLQPFFEKHEIDYEDTLVIRRELSPNGKSRAFINDGLVTLTLIKSLSSHLIDIFAQFDTLEIQHQTEQLKMLDALGTHQKSLVAYRKAYTSYVRKQQSLTELRTNHESSKQKESFLEFQLKELEELAVAPGEYDQLDRKQSLLSEAIHIDQTLAMLLETLDEGNQNVCEAIQKCLSAIQHLKIQPDGLKDIRQRLDSVLIELEDIVQGVARIRSDQEDIQEDPQYIEERLASIHRVLRKHGFQSDIELLEFQKSIRSELDSQQSQEENLLRIEKELASIEQELLKFAKDITRGRTKAGKILAKKIKANLAQLAMDDARLEVQLSHTSIGPMGTDDVSFLFSANLGGKLLPIKDVASGGELSRLNLSMKSILADQETMPTLVFDEIDTGISGMVAEKMGMMMHQLSTHHQIICITHAPQIAAKANKHYFVYKTKEGNRTKTQVKELKPKDRITEIAIMLSTNPPTESALANAKELLEL